MTLTLDLPADLARTHRLALRRPPVAEQMRVIGARIREKRLALGMRQTDLHVKAQVNLAEISRIENGRYIPSDETLDRICAVLNIDREEEKW